MKTSGQINIEKIEKSGYIASPTLKLQIRAALANKPVAGSFLFGPAGSGKTFLAETLALAENADTYFYQCFPGTREDDLLVKMLPSDETQSGVRLHDGVVMQAAKACKSNSRKLVYLIIDEWDKTRPSADSFLLDFLQSGRINYNGYSIRIPEIKMKKLRVFITLNDERELSEPLLRRLPLITFDFLSTSRVKSALMRSHPGSEYIDAACILHEKTLQAGMSKPATVQELRQLLDAIEELGGEADWDTLVFQFVTKSAENHALLKRVEHFDTHFEREERTRIDAERYSQQEVEPQAEEIPQPKMPKLADRFDKSISVTTTEIDLEKSRGIIKLTDSAYNGIAEQTKNLSVNEISGIADFTEDVISLKKSFALEDIDEWRGFLGEEGEILLTTSCSLEHIKKIQKKGVKIIKIAENEILGKMDGMDCRYVRNGDKFDCEFVVDLQDTAWEKILFGFGCMSKDNVFNYEEKEVEEQEPEAPAVMPKKPALSGRKCDVVFNICEYIRDLHNYLFGWAPQNEDAKAGQYKHFLSYPDKYDISGWETRLQTYKNCKLIFDELDKFKEYVDIEIKEYKHLGGSLDAAEIKVAASKGKIKYLLKDTDIEERIKECEDALAEINEEVDYAS